MNKQTRKFILGLIILILNSIALYLEKDTTGKIMPLLGMIFGSLLLIHSAFND